MANIILNNANSICIKLYPMVVDMLEVGKVEDMDTAEGTEVDNNNSNNLIT